MAIVYYTQQNEFDLVNTGQDCIGWTVVDQAGNKIGEVTEMLISVEKEKVDSILVNGGKRIDAQDFSLVDKRVVVRGIMHDGNLEMSGANDSKDAQIHDQPMVREAEAKHVAGLTRAAKEGETIIPIVEEQLHIGKRAVESGKAQVSTTIMEKPVTETVNLREENVTVERRPVDRAVENAPAAFKEGTIEVTEMAEVPVVSKEARVVEEVVVGKNVTERAETVSDTVKRTEVNVDETTCDSRNDESNR